MRYFFSKSVNAAQNTSKFKTYNGYNDYEHYH
jgi:hypothetical protein